MAWAKHLVAGIVSLGAFIAVATMAHGQGLEFRVDTEVFKNDEKQPILEQLTIFSADGAVYDYMLTGPKEVTVFDPRNGRFTLLDETRKIKAIVETQDLMGFTMQLQQAAAKQRNSLIVFCADPHFETTANEIERQGQTMTELKLVGKPLTYTALGQKPQQSDAVKIYRHFADWCARLNATRDANLPPMARLELNREFAERGLLPFEVIRSIPPPNPLGKKVDYKMEHRVNWALCGDDRKKIDNAGDMMATFEVVSYMDFCAPDKKPAPLAAK